MRQPLPWRERAVREFLAEAKRDDKTDEAAELEYLLTLDLSARATLAYLRALANGCDGWMPGPWLN